MNPIAKHHLRLSINGKAWEGLVESRASLLTVLREQCGIVGPKRGCEEGECGACGVMLDGRLVDSCIVFAVEAGSKSIMTVEGLGSAEHLSPLQSAFAEAGASQCGYCIPGMLLAATALLEENPTPDEAAVRRAIAGNLCRCTGYHRIVEAVQLAAKLKQRDAS